MSQAAIERDPSRLFAAARVDVERRGDGTIVLRSPVPLGAYDRCVGDWLVRWARERPGTAFLMERADGTSATPWTTLTYGDALAKVEAIASWILDKGLGVDRPLVVLSENSINHALVALAAMHVGVPVSPVSPAYSLVSQDFEKLKYIVDLLTPGAIFVSRQSPYAKALAAVAPRFDGDIIVGRVETGEALGPRMTSLDAVMARTDRGAVAAAFAGIGPDTIGKFLFTSGSTGQPKGVVNTHRMMCSSQQARLRIWPFLERSPPTTIDWLPWSHTFGGNHNFNMVLRCGGTIAIDGGKPLPGAFQTSLDNIKSVAATQCFNVPRGFDMLVPALRKDDELREKYFDRLQLIFYAAAALPQNLWDGLTELAIKTVGRPIPLVSSWGSTETSPLASDCHWQAERTGVIGLPVPGTELKLVPSGSKLEIRVKGPNVTPGYWKKPDLTAQAFDTEGFYSMGDAVKFLDAAHPEKGLLFDGRVAEDFKLMSGTWVSVGALRIHALECLAPIAQDIVVTGHDREEIGFLIFPNVAACRQIAGLADAAPVADVLGHGAVREATRQGLLKLKQQGRGSSTFATRAILMAEPPSIDAGEITDKGYTNQQAVRTRRNSLVEAIYADAIGPEIISLPG
jgi:feruloyl-CoA synthase